MKEGFNPIDVAKSSLHPLVLDYVELSDEAAQNPPHKAHLDQQRFPLIETIAKDENLRNSLTEFVIFRNQIEGEKK